MTAQTIVTESFLQEKENQKSKLLIIGDLIIDRTIYCTVSKISPEAPVPVAMIEPNGIVETPGGAGLAASYASKNNIDSIFLTVVGNDKETFIDNCKIDYEQLEYKSPLNPRKTRYIDIKSNHQLLRADTDAMIDKSIFHMVTFQDAFLKLFNKILKEENISGIVILDYCKGIFNRPRIAYEIINIAADKGIQTYVDTRRHDLSIFSGVNILKLNDKEFTYAKNSCNPRYLGLDYLVVTHGKDGASIFQTKNNIFTNLENFKSNLGNYSGTPDATGCGDVFDVTFCENWCINKNNIVNSLKIAVDKATKFAYTPIEERLNVNTRTKNK